VSVKVSLVGMQELRAALQRLPAELTEEAAKIVDAAANSAKLEVYGRYPQKTGNLRKGLRVTHNAGRRFGTTAVLKSSSPHASIFEFGTVRRSTNKGANRGSMPPASDAKAFIPVVIRVRRKMVRQLVELVRRAGFTVSD